MEAGAHGVLMGNARRRMGNASSIGYDIVTIQNPKEMVNNVVVAHQRLVLALTSCA